MKQSRGISRALCRSVLFTALFLTIPTLALAQQSAEVELDIPAQPLASALKVFAEQTGMQLLYRAEVVDSVIANPVRGSGDSRLALEQLLEGTGLEAVYSGTNAATIRPRASPRDGDGSRVDPSHDPAAGVDNTMGAEPTGLPAPRNAAASTLDTVVVTGTRIRGGETPSPVTMIGYEDMREQGFTDLGEVIRSIPQNFRGGQNPGVAAGAESGPAGIANRDVTGGASLNLRGLGPDASLTLLNGRRLAYGGYSQTVDISAIPVDAVDRIEIVADGASAIYGSDAVGGVGNVILRRDYEGATIGALYGDTADGGMATREYSATAGTVWQGGGLIATYKHASVDPIRADQRDYTADMPSPTTIYPASTLRSGLLSAHQALGDALEFRLDAFRTQREQLYYNYYSVFSSYHSRFSPETTTTLVAPTIEVSFASDWQLSFGAAWGRDERVLDELMVFSGTGDTMQSPYDDCFCNESRVYEIGAEGPLFALAGGDARLAIGTGHRSNEFVDRLVSTGETRIGGDEASRFAYAELGMPLLGPGADGDGAPRLTLTAALRGEDYDSFGSVVTPKLGFVYGPNADYTLKASWGRSFKAPTLLQRYQEMAAVLYPASILGGDPGLTTLATFGGNPDLEPERARSWTTSLAVHPRALPAFEAELTLFDIDYTDRVVQPIGNYGEALTNPIYGRYVELSPSAQRQAEVMKMGSGVFRNYSGSAYDPDMVQAVVFAHFVNVARQRVRGVDLSGSYGFDIDAGRLELRGSGSWLDSTQKNGPDDAAFDLAGTLFSPAKVNARAGLVWLQGGFTASAFGNYVSGVRDPLADTTTASFTTFDLALRYSIDDRAGLRSGWDFALSAHNLLNRAPPQHATLQPTWVPYDSTNYSAIGRYLGLSVSKRF